MRSNPAPHRRPRYPGTHPRRFEQRYKELAPENHPGIHDHVRAQGRTPAGSHVPVLLAEVLDVLRPAAGETVADCTIGHGGHAFELLRQVGHSGRLVGLDVDAVELERAKERFAAAGLDSRVSLHRCHYAGLGKVMALEGTEGFDVILADLGVSSMQIDNPARGFSYKHDGPLDMRMDQRLRRTAADWLAQLSEEELSAALRDLADEPGHHRISRAIVRERAARPITRTAHLVRIVESSLATAPAKAVRLRGALHVRPREASGLRTGDHSEELHPAARTFQALRILVNDEMAGLEQFLRIAPYCLRPGGRLGIISFHSGEDRRVQESFALGAETGLYAATSESPIRPTPAERRDNPRSASASLRWALKH